MSRRNNDAITIHSILSWIEDNLESPCRWKKCLSAPVTLSGTCNVCLRKTGHSLGQYIPQPKLTEIAQKLKQSNEPILYLAERYGFSRSRP